MKFETNKEKLRCRIEVPSHLRGWSNLVHGGIISTMIDETMSWSVLHLLGKLFLTKSIKVNFKNPLTSNLTRSFQKRVQDWGNFFYLPDLANLPEKKYKLRIPNGTDNFP